MYMLWKKYTYICYFNCNLTYTTISAICSYLHVIMVTVNIRHYYFCDIYSSNVIIVYAWAAILIVVDPKNI